jgi:hypothetical protein
MSPRECVRCRAYKKNQRRCSRITCKYADYCYQHTKKEKGLQVKNSNIPNAGLGLFATKRFKKGEKIADFGGVLVPYSTYQSDPSGYGIHINKNKILDSKSTQSGLARYANNCRGVVTRRGSCKGNNSRIVVNTRQKSASLRATSSIASGREVYPSGYSRAFFRSN